MHIRLWCTLALVFVNCCPYTIPIQRLRLPKSKQFLLLRTTTIDQRACTCSTSFSCSCCETVTLIYSKMRKTLCSNFMYQRNGLNVDISLNMDTLKMMTVTVYRPFKMCTTIPGSLFSSICVNVVELNEFPRSLTVCVRHEITSKFQEWQINYTCVSISTILPMVATSMTSQSGMASMATTAMSAAPSMPAPTASTSKAPMPMMSMMSMMPAMPAMPMMASTAAPMASSQAMTMAMVMMMPPPAGGTPGQMGAMPPPAGGTPGQMGAMPPPGGGTPGQMGAMPPPGGGTPGQMGAMTPAGQMGAMRPPGQMGAMPSSGQMGAMPASGQMSAMRPPGQMGAMPPSGQMGAMPASGQMSAMRPPGQMGAMPPPGGGPPPATMAATGRRKKRNTQTWRHRCPRIVNNKFGNPPSDLEDSIRPIVTMFRTPSASISNIPIVVVASGGALADARNPISADVTTTNYNGRPSGPGLPIVYESTNQYPSRIPPVVAMSLKGESAINSNGGDAPFMADTNNVLKKNTVSLVFPD